MIKSSRVFNEVRLFTWSFNEQFVGKPLKVLAARQNDITKLSLCASNAVHPQVIRLLSSLNNLAKIEIDVNFLNDVLLNDSAHSLKHLKHVKSFVINFHLAEVVLYLPDNVLTKLSFITSYRNPPPSPLILKQIFKNQTNIDDLDIDTCNLSPAMLKHLRLKTLRLVKNRHLETILNDH